MLEESLVRVDQLLQLTKVVADVRVAGTLEMLRFLVEVGSTRGVPLAMRSRAFRVLLGLSERCQLAWTPALAIKTLRVVGAFVVEPFAREEAKGGGGGGAADVVDVDTAFRVMTRALRSLPLGRWKDAQWLTPTLVGVCVGGSVASSPARECLAALVHSAVWCGGVDARTKLVCSVGLVQVLRSVAESPASRLIREPGEGFEGDDDEAAHEVARAALRDLEMDDVSLSLD